MTESNYTKLFTGNFIIVQLIVDKLKAIGINPVIKDETESGRGAIFGSSSAGLQELYVHLDEIDQASHVVEDVRSEMEA